MSHRNHSLSTVGVVEAMPEMAAELVCRIDAGEAETIRDWSRAWLAAWNAHDLEGTLALVADGIVYEDPSMFGEHIVGKEAFARFLTMTWGAFPDMVFEVDGDPYLSLAGTSLAIPWRAIGTFTGDMRGGPSPMEIAPTDHAFSIRGVDLYNFRDGLLWHWTSVVDLMELARQTGMLPMPHTPLFRMAIKAQRLLSPLLRRRAPR